MSENVFLFNPGNQSFLSGESRRIEQGFWRKLPIFQATLLTFLILVNLLLVALNFSDLSATETAFGSAIETQGTILSCSAGASLFGTMRANYEYVVNTANGGSTSYSGSDVVYGACTPATATTPIQIRYLPSEPSRSDGVGGDADTRVQVIVGLAITGCYVLGVIAYCISWRRLKRLENEGRVVQGSIVSYGKRIPWLPQRYVIAHYQFTNDVGTVLKGRYPILLKRLEGKPLPPVGTPMAVVYADDRTYQAL